MDNKKKKCDFCGKAFSKDDIKKGTILFSGESYVLNENTNKNENVKICSNCIKESYEKYTKIYNKNNDKNNDDDAIAYSPESIKEYLDKWIIGQEKAKIVISTEVYNHKKRIKRLEENPDANKKLRIDKSNIIMVGPSGSGKTEIVRALGEILDIPYVIENATSYTASGLI